jgi:hypothetical protein
MLALLVAVVVVVGMAATSRSAEKAWPGAFVIDVTSKGEEPWVRFLTRLAYSPSQLKDSGRG